MKQMGTPPLQKVENEHLAPINSVHNL